MGSFCYSYVRWFQIFLTIVDDYSRATLIYLLKSKAHVLSIFPGFLQLIETQYHAKVKAVRYENAHELKYTDLYLARGIVAFHSCLETP